ncbi:MAG: hypothetical protein LBK58_04240, partial [Prevotellaceae bacterium]|nr:hypothetical protein [Prevotellaceae bacterium]
MIQTNMGTVIIIGYLLLLIFVMTVILLKIVRKEKVHLRTCLFLLNICMFSCSKPYSNELKTVLEQAGKNRRELEKVL